ncbi:MAG: ATP-dependent DNA helicase RecQ [Deltaproteobacteria bacterium]|nr:ATP-dependent DNA helicase RecQ [Deltaproteobacteria bacterium]
METRLQERFGLEAFRPWQRETIDALLTGEGHALVVAPTGGGKSLCYQFPATELEGTTLVVSPLIALMEDQVEGLSRRGISATYLASTLGRDELGERERRLFRGDYDLVYVAPERLANPWLLDRLRELSPPLIAIDEAHCISQWGHDFRPDYLRLRGVLDALRPPRVLACTATATPKVRAEILARLGFEERPHRVVLRGFARPNLHLEALELDTKRQRDSLLLEALTEALGSPSQPKGAAIVYAATRRNTERVASELRDHGFDARAYHAGLAPSDREEVSQRFAAQELDVVVATNAFGMGIDRPDIRVVVHTQAPGSIEAYYQEVGRAGRDGQPARGVLMSSSSDIGLRRRLIEGDGGRSEAMVEQQWKLFLDLRRYVEAGSCRHDFILRYFGDEAELLGGCGHCDVCERLEETGGVEREVSDADALCVRKALSGVARCHDRVGMRAVAEMLHGKDTDKTRRLGLTRLSTFGLLPEHKPDFLLALLRRLVTAGLVTISGDSYPLVLLTRAGVEVMKGESPVRVLLPEEDVGPKGTSPRARGKRKKKPKVELAAADEALFEALREARMLLAKERGVPAYVVCHDRTLAEIASSRPTDLEALSDVHGMGPARIEHCGDALVAVVRSAG